MVKHERYSLAPGQSCVVYSQESPLLIGASPFGPKGHFSLRIAGEDKKQFEFEYNHPMLGRTFVDVSSPPGFISYFSHEEHLQDSHSSCVIHLTNRPLSGEYAKEELIHNKIAGQRR